MEEPDEALDRLARPFDDGLDRAVGTVSNPPRDSVCAGALSRRVAEEHALHSAAHFHPLPDTLLAHRKDSCKQAFPSGTAAILGSR